jgi:hypothetical protein
MTGTEDGQLQCLAQYNVVLHLDRMVLMADQDDVLWEDVAQSQLL